MSRRTVYAGKIFSIVHEEHTGVDGVTVVYETVGAPDVVRVYPVRDGLLWLIREYRQELGRAILRTVSGRIEAGETPELAAERELREELGGVARTARVFAISQPILKVRSLVHHVLVEMSAMTSSNPEPGERIQAAAFSVGEIEPLVWDGKITEDVIALQLLRLARDPAFVGYVYSSFGSAARGHAHRQS
jgi:8-oxo-dGTP pyrophosphatase MutT (NUDIX family)